MVRLDEILDDKENYNFLTIDVQGYELEVLKGSRETLKNINYILIEVNRDELYKNSARVEELDEFLGEFNFQRAETSWEGETWRDAFYLKR
uniref:FkbM family methyltransferase n=1 Tax=Okeania sp. SIO2F4 TaxID=2607790 RepID=UPI0025F1B34E|nr:FkbM family methyltransferase [Okeania sp. SIO2F4]